MANLVERITGAAGDKIPLHAFCAAFNEYRRGKLTGAFIVAAFALDAAQTTQAQTLKNLINTAPDPTQFMRVFKDLLYLGEVDFSPEYRDIAFINTRLQDEVAEQVV